ncbi:hypothetical protein NDU88_004873 [Pleurodeles waltl]|uniref:Uncharacterized protein n=1 Tax=Pleurodeles waltl TaxID=8319 RepID=A0AAV7VJY1_PLEWA|nr:hypothetical protein NDU88_004873 [Pleurodeles waltl]
MRFLGAERLQKSSRSFGVVVAKQLQPLLVKYAVVEKKKKQDSTGHTQCTCRVRSQFFAASTSMYYRPAVQRPERASF